MNTSAPESLSVHTLSQFAFCLRAGLLAYESRRNEALDPEDIALTYSPPYEANELTRQWKRAAWWKTVLTIALVANLGLFVLLFRFGLIGLAIGLCSLFGLWQWRKNVALLVQRLEHLRAEAASATAADLRLDSKDSQSVHWWQITSPVRYLIKHAIVFRNSIWAQITGEFSEQTPPQPSAQTGEQHEPAEASATVPPTNASPGIAPEVKNTASDPAVPSQFDTDYARRWLKKVDDLPRSKDE